MTDDLDAPEHLALIEELTEISFDPNAAPRVPLTDAVEATLILLGKMAVRRRAEGDHKIANAAEVAIEAFGPIFTELDEEIDIIERGTV